MPNIKKNIFNPKNLNTLLSRIEKNSIPDFDSFQEIISNWIKYIRSGNISSTKETAIQGKFLDDIFSNILGYQSRVKNTDIWNLNSEQLTTIDGKFVDAALGFFTIENEDIKVVIELKDAATNLDERQHRHNDIRTPIEQAFSYQHKIGKSCKWVIVSNYKEIRLYHHSSSTEYEVFFIEELSNWDNFNRFYYLLNKENLIAKTGESLVDSLFAKNEEEEQNISKKFYSEFKQARLRLFEHLKENNIYHINVSTLPPIFDIDWELVLLEKTQKFLDRFIFICFCEDNKLLPTRTIHRVIEIAKESWSDSETRFWDEFKHLFQAINIGSAHHNVNKFNGGLFATDGTLDNLIIKNSILEEIAKLSEYDFATEIDVNILGHIFEQSISDIEEIKAGIEGKEFDKKLGKRKKDGIYYTPEYITKYIVENAVGGWLEDRKKELGYYELPEITNDELILIKKTKSKTRTNGNVQKHLEFWLAYKEKLMNIKILDPACGSGAFLNQAFNFLYAEGQKVNDTIAELSGGQGELFELDKHILSNNLYGVDLNSESVEITKLSLWIKTANKYSELTALDDNIKCGNSLIDDPVIAGHKAFNWFREFPKVFPRYRDYKKKTQKPEIIDATYPDIQEIRERNLKEPEVEYNTNSEDSEIEYIVHEPAYSYESGSKGYERHGFDVIISNPPYGAKLSREEIIYLDNKYFNLSSTKNSAIYFILRAYNIVKTDGFISFIVPKSICYSSGWNDIANKIHKNLLKLIDTGEAFQEVLLEQVIFVNKVNSHTGYYESGTCIYNRINIVSKIEKSIFEDFSVLLAGLNSSEFRLLKRILSVSKYRYNDLVRIERGLNWQSKSSTDKTRNPIFRGAQLNRYYLDNNTDFVNLNDFELVDYNYQLQPKVLNQLAIAHVKNPYPHFYLQSFLDESKRLVFETISCTFPKKDDVDLKFILALNNSKLFAWILYKFVYSNAIRSTRFDEKYVSKIPVPEIPNQVPFISLADTMLEKNKELQVIRKAFLKFTTEQFKIDKPSTKHENWYELDYFDFIKELEKKKIKLTSSDKFDLKPLFEREKQKALEIKAIIDQSDKEIDRMVYELYGLTEEEINIVEGI